LIGGITRRSTFDRLRREGVRVRRGALGLTYVPFDASRPEVAIAVGRRLGNAVRRNRWRRRLRAQFDARIRRGALASGAYLVQVQTPLDELSASALDAEVSAVLDALAARLAA
jgi:ribonuclease P protein component